MMMTMMMMMKVVILQPMCLVSITEKTKNIKNQRNENESDFSSLTQTEFFFAKKKKEITTTNNPPIADQLDSFIDYDLKWILCRTEISREV